MTFEHFEMNFPRDGAQIAVQAVADAASVPDVGALRQFMEKFGGGSFRNGLYRVVETHSLNEWLDRVSLAFPEYRTRITCFGYDWLGRVFALDSTRSEQGQPGVILLEPGTGESLIIPANLETFHSKELQIHGEAALAISFYNKWIQSGIDFRCHRCHSGRVVFYIQYIDRIGALLPLDDIEVYWHVSAQLIQQVRGLPPGTRIGKVTIG